MLLSEVSLVTSRVDKFDESLRWLNKAVVVNSKIKGDEVNLSSTHLNVCALYSKKGQHELAYKNAKTALRLLPLAYRRMK